MSTSIIKSSSAKAVDLKKKITQSAPTLQTISTTTTQAATKLVTTSVGTSVISSSSTTAKQSTILLVALLILPLAKSIALSQFLPTIRCATILVTT